VLHPLPPTRTPSAPVRHTAAESAPCGPDTDASRHTPPAEARRYEPPHHPASQGQTHPVPHAKPQPDTKHPHPTIPEAPVQTNPAHFLADSAETLWTTDKPPQTYQPSEAHF